MSLLIHDFFPSGIYVEHAVNLHNIKQIIERGISLHLHCNISKRKIDR
jgi:predicted amino acid-binding ACT domain protein